jgi:hypothetical protein
MYEIIPSSTGIKTNLYPLATLFSLLDTVSVIDIACLEMISSSAIGLDA